jgi:hypothetical protein
MTPGQGWEADMLVFAKDIRKRDHKHSREEIDPRLREYMEYQRRIFPYTIIRAGLDVAYKELDDILSFVENGYRPPAGSAGREFPADVRTWFKERYPWTSAFLGMEAAHSFLVVLIKAMDSFRTQEIMNSCHWMTLYDVSNGIVKFYNDLLSFSPERARDIRLSKDIRVNFDDFVNNYWTSLDFMIMSRPDYPHARLLERNREIEKKVFERVSEGDDPAEALEKVAGDCGIDDTTLALLRREPFDPAWLELKSLPPDADPYDRLSRDMPGNPAIGKISVIDAEYAMNYKFYREHARPVS